MSRSIFIIRHGEKPPDDKPGVDGDKNPNPHSLIPIGWARANALPTLFTGPIAWFPTPTELIAPDYGSPDRDAIERTHETITPLASLLGLQPETPFKEKHEAALGAQVAAATSGMTLICWEHKAIHVIANAIPTPAGTLIPQSWPGDRFDVVWVFEADGAGTYAFSQVPQLLLPGDTDTIISP
jgi:broad specificity phosphatase PhoE